MLIAYFLFDITHQYSLFLVSCLLQFLIKSVAVTAIFILLLFFQFQSATVFFHFILFQFKVSTLTIEFHITVDASYQRKTKFIMIFWILEYLDL